MITIIISGSLVHFYSTRSHNAERHFIDTYAFNKNVFVLIDMNGSE